MENTVVWAVVVAMILSFCWFLLHLIVGGRQIAGPLRQSEGVSHTVMATMWMCWHMVTACLILMAVFFGMGLVYGAPFVVAGTMMAAVFAVSGIWARFALGTTFKILPQGWLFVPIAGIGLYGVLAG